VSLPDSSLNILHENPTVPCGCISVPLMNTEGDLGCDINKGSSNVLVELLPLILKE